LFAGIGGFDLGLERAGFEVRWQVEIDPFCRSVLAKHWPAVKRYEDVKECCAGMVRVNREDSRCVECGRRDWLPWVDVIVGGFPCQDVSESGARAGIDGPQSGLWREMSRLVGELRPRFVIVENVSGLLVSGMGRVVGDLSRLGYDAEWGTLSACAFGAPHTRERVFIVAYPDEGRRRTSGPREVERRTNSYRCRSPSTRSN
jgi:DNA (cytosine-5)-methyltransferase 1